MKLLIVVLNSPDKLEEVLEGLVEAGVTGATVMDSVGMGHILEDVPLFAGVRSIFRTAKPHNNTIISVIQDAQSDEAMSMLQRILCGAGDRKKSCGIAFVVPIERSVGI